MIYIVEDDDNIRELVVYTLENTSYKAKGFKDSEAFWLALKKEAPDLVILDIMLPKEDGLSILKKIRQSESLKEIAIIMMSAKGSEYDKVIGLDLGADDYLAKPVGMVELVARVKNLLKRVKPKADTGLQLGNVIVDLERYEVRVDEKIVSLTKKEFDLLVCLIQNKGIVLSREKLLNTVWGIDFEGESRTVDTHILTLRGKLKNGNIIKTVRGVGYKAEGSS